MSKQKLRHSSRDPRRPQRSASSPVIPIVVAVVVLAILVGVILSIERGRPVAARSPGGSASPSNTAQALNTTSIPYPDVPRVTLEETQSKLEQGQAVLIDVRSRSSYDQGHAAGAISMPEEEVAARLGELPRDKEIILYCT
jgi:hypothetical protein